MKNEKRLDNYILLFVIVAYAVIYFLVIAKALANYAALINLGFIAILAGAAFFMYKFPKNELVGVKKKILYEMFIAIFVYFSLIYILGIFTGFYNNPYSQRLAKIFTNSIVPLITVVCLELFRYMYLSKNKDQKSAIVFGTMACLLFDIVIAFYPFELNLTNFFSFATLTMLPLIFKNVVLSYITVKGGYQSCLVYVIPLGIFKYLVPVLPALGDYLNCIINISLPAIVYIYASRLVTDDLLKKEVKRLADMNDTKVNDLILSKKFKRKVNLFKVFIIDIPIIVFLSIFVTLISGIYMYHLIGVDTSAVTPQISRGDAIIIYKNLKNSEYRLNDIVVYKADDKLIVDRIAKVSANEDGTNDLYVKEAIEEDEIKYKEITNDIIGRYNNFRVPKVAYPTIWFKDKLKGDKK